MLEVLYEDNHIIAVNKKISDIVQADKTGDTPLSEEVKAHIKKKYNKPGEVYLGYCRQFAGRGSCRTHPLSDA